LINTKADSYESVLLLTYIDKSIGCSLTIHRVDISAVCGKLMFLSIDTVPQTAFDCVNHEFNCSENCK